MLRSKSSNGISTASFRGPSNCRKIKIDVYDPLNGEIEDIPPGPADYSKPDFVELIKKHTKPSSMFSKTR